MKGRLIFTQTIQVGPEEWVQDFKTIDIEVPSNVADVTKKMHLVGMTFVSDDEAKEGDE